MTAGPATSRGRAGATRTLVAVLALYALLLQGFLGGLMPAVMAADGIHCAPPAAGGDEPAKLPHTHLDCCLVAHLAAGAIPARDPVAAAIRPPRVVATVAWLSAPPYHPRGPPEVAAHPRGPPAL